MSNIILFNKPYHVLSQFSDGANGSHLRFNLADYLRAPGYRVAGRLDFDSEGLLVLTDDGREQQKITNPKHGNPKTYWVQVEGTPDRYSIDALQNGVQLKDGFTLPAKCKVVSPPNIWERQPPIRKRKKVTTCWLELTIVEGRNRQVRRMTASIGHPTLRLVRYSVGNWSLGTLLPGQWVKAKV